MVARSLLIFAILVKYIEEENVFFKKKLKFKVLGILRSFPLNSSFKSLV